MEKIKLKFAIYIIAILCLFVLFDNCQKRQQFLFGDVIQMGTLQTQSEDPVMKKVFKIKIKNFNTLNAKIVVLETEKDTINFFLSESLIEERLVVIQPFIAGKNKGFTVVNLKNRSILYLLAPKKDKLKQKMIEQYIDSITPKPSPRIYSS